MNLCGGPSKVSEHGASGLSLARVRCGELWTSQTATVFEKANTDRVHPPIFGVDQSELHRVRCRYELPVRCRVVLADAL